MATIVQTQALALPSLVGDSSMCGVGLFGKLGGDFVIGGFDGLGDAVLQTDQPTGAGGLIQNRAHELGRSPLRLTKAGHEQAGEGDEPRPRLAGRHTLRKFAAGAAAA